MCLPLSCKSLSWIYIGSRYDAKNLNTLRSNNIKYILNVTPQKSQGGVPNFHSNNHNFTYCRIPLSDIPSEKLSGYYEEAWTFIERARIRQDGNLLVHCNQGISRSVSIVCAYIIKYHMMDFDEAMILIKKSRPTSKPNQSFHKQLIQLDEETKKENSYRLVKTKLPNDSNNNKAYETNLQTTSSTLLKASTTSSSLTNSQLISSDISRKRPPIGPMLPPWHNKSHKILEDSLTFYKPLTPDKDQRFQQVKMTPIGPQLPLVLEQPDDKLP